MTADVKLLPLPEADYRLSPDGNPCLHDSETLVDYASANVAHATAAKDAEIEALRAEASTAHDAVLYHIAEHAKTRARAERLAEAINAVLADMSEWGEPAKGAHILRVINFLSMVLHPTAAQENDDA